MKETIIDSPRKSKYTKGNGRLRNKVRTGPFSGTRRNKNNWG